MKGSFERTQERKLHFPDLPNFLTMSPRLLELMNVTVRESRYMVGGSGLVKNVSRDLLKGRRRENYIFPDLPNFRVVSPRLFGADECDSPGIQIHGGGSGVVKKLSRDLLKERKRENYIFPDLLNLRVSMSPRLLELMNVTVRESDSWRVVRELSKNCRGI
ncbi:hypothetical protein CEXT_754301 [Caerostris extrusa]|uniref:Uncharacterized protein n=1 Tax=Caerostris extrusa TaxID=172846 RepID=A0AAV4XI05_CAEEX|nr:hypothetical protein CEXT_754301 [Caerostris extrusa]